MGERRKRAQSRRERERERDDGKSLASLLLWFRGSRSVAVAVGRCQDAVSQSLYFRHAAKWRESCVVRLVISCEEVDFRGRSICVYAQLAISHRERAIRG